MTICERKLRCGDFGPVFCIQSRCDFCILDPYLPMKDKNKNNPPPKNSQPPTTPNTPGLTSGSSVGCRCCTAWVYRQRSSGPWLPADVAALTLFCARCLFCSRQSARWGRRLCHMSSSCSVMIVRTLLQGHCFCAHMCVTSSATAGCCAPRLTHGRFVFV